MAEPERQGQERSNEDAQSSSNGREAGSGVEASPLQPGASMWTFTPEQAAELLARRPDLRDELITWLHQNLGASFVRRTLVAVDNQQQTGGSAKGSKAPESQLTPPCVVQVTAADGLRVRRTPGVSADDNVLGALGTHVKIEALAREGEWLRINFHGAPAYIHGGFVELAPTHAESTHAESSSGSSTQHAESGATGAGGATPKPRVESTHEQSAGDFTTLSGNTIAESTTNEAAVLAALRADPRRFDPTWLIVAQRKLGVVDATGAFNTETLRAMRSHAGNQALGADEILNPAFLAGVAPGTPFAAVVDGYGDYGEIDATATARADHAAPAVGYPSYEAYWAILEHGTFLGKSLKQGSSDGRVHPYLAARLRVAEAYLRQRHPGGDEAVIKAIGWNGVIGGAYQDTQKDIHAKDPKSHMHTMGLAVDVDASANPYIFGGDGTQADTTSNWIAKFYEDTSRVAARAFGGAALAPGSLNDTSKQLSTEELHAHVTASSNAFKQYVELSEQPEDAIVKILVAKGHYTEAEAKAELSRFAEARKMFHDAKGNRKYHQLTNIGMDLLVALRDVAGLAWGGTEMSTIQNGDFMHFDCRNDEFGHAVYSRTAPKNRGTNKKK